MSSQTDTRRRLLVALALERSRAGSPVDGALRRALEGERRERERPEAAPEARGQAPDGSPRAR